MTFCLGLVLCALLPLTQSLDQFLLFSTQDAVCRMNLDGSNCVPLCNSTDIQDVDYLYAQRKVVWGSVISGDAGYGDFSGSNPTCTLVSLPWSELAVDWKNRDVFFSYRDGGSTTPNRLAVNHMFNNPFNPVRPLGLYHDLAVDAVNNVLYWVSDDKLFQYLSGGSPEVMYTAPAGCTLNRLSHVDYFNNKLFYTVNDCTSKGVYHLDLSTTPPTTEDLYTGAANAPYGDVTSYMDNVCWDSQGQLKCGPITGSGPVSSVNYCCGPRVPVGPVVAITVVHHSLQP